MKRLAKLLTNGKIKAGVYIPIELKEAQLSSIATCCLLEKTKRTNKPTKTIFPLFAGLSRNSIRTWIPRYFHFGSLVFLRRSVYCELLLSSRSPSGSLSHV